MGRAPSRQDRRARRRCRATDTRRARAPSVGSTRISRSGRATSRLSFNAHDLAPHPVACREPGPPRQRMAGRFKLSRVPRVPRLASGCPAARALTGREKDASLRLLQPNCDPSTPWIARFPGALPAWPLALAGEKRGGARRLTLGPWPAVSPQVKPRLTAKLQLRPRRDPSGPGALGLPRARRRSDAVVPRGPGGASIECSSARNLPAAAFSTARRACDVASDALCREASASIRPFGRISSVTPPGAASAAVSSKTAASSAPGRLPSTRDVRDARVDFCNP